jgi:hypothetical protein
LCAANFAVDSDDTFLQSSGGCPLFGFLHPVLFGDSLLLSLADFLLAHRLSFNDVALELRQALGLLCLGLLPRRVHCSSKLVGTILDRRRLPRAKRLLQASGRQRRVRRFFQQGIDQQVLLIERCDGRCKLLTQVMEKLRVLGRNHDLAVFVTAGGVDWTGQGLKGRFPFCEVLRSRPFLFQQPNDQL